MASINIRQMHVWYQFGITMDKLLGVHDGIKKILAIAGVDQKIKIQYLGQRREYDWWVQLGPANVWYLKPYRSLDWHIYNAARYSQVAWHLNSALLLDSIITDPVHQQNLSYELVVAMLPMHWHSNSKRIVGGVGQESQAAVLSISDYLHLLYPPPNGVVESVEEKMRRAYEFHAITQALTLHELGHVFGLFSVGTTAPNATDEDLKATHCQNECVMRSKLFPNFLKKIIDKPFCDECEANLQKFFIAP